MGVAQVLGVRVHGLHAFLGGVVGHQVATRRRLYQLRVLASLERGCYRRHLLALIAGSRRVSGHPLLLLLLHVGDHFLLGCYALLRLLSAQTLVHLRLR